MGAFGGLLALWRPESSPPTLTWRPPAPPLVATRCPLAPEEMDELQRTEGVCAAAAPSYTPSDQESASSKASPTLPRCGTQER